MKKPMYVMVACALQAYQNCQKSENPEWESIWHDRLDRQLAKMLPSGSGFDSGSSLDIDASQPEKLVFNTAFHHMNDDGYYVGWTNHQVIVTPSFAYGFSLRITGKDKKEIKDYIAEVFHQVLNDACEWESEI